MRRNNSKEDYLLISGFQHFMFCKHQWGLIHLEDVWIDNILTYEGKLVHERVDNPEIKETRKQMFISRSVAVVSHSMKIQGVIDLIEFIENKKGIYIKEKANYYLPIIIEYKRGKPKEGLEDKVQICAQAICFEEMMNCKLEYGYIYYFRTKKREKVFFSKDLREIVEQIALEMNSYIIEGKPTRPEKSQKCKNCSLADICSKNFPKVDMRNYVKGILSDLE